MSTVTSITTRAADRNDIPRLVEFNAAMAWETERKHLDLAVLTRGITAVFDDPQRGFYRVAERDGVVVAGLLVTYEWSDWRDGVWWWIQSVYVCDEARRSGVFAKLYAELQASAQSTPGVVGLRLYVEWDNARARLTYEGLGMSQAHYHMYQRSFVALD
jgi:GNAT superfamily N-acetyltransferase